MRITHRQLRQIIKEELSRTLLERDPFGDLDAELDSGDRGSEDANYPANESEAKSIVPKMFAELEKESDPFEKMDIKLKYGLSNQRNDVFTFKKKGGGSIKVTVPGFRRK